MAAPPPYSSASVSRGAASVAQRSGLADDLLRASLGSESSKAKANNSVRSVSASVPDVSPLALRISTPPSYRSRDHVPRLDTPMPSTGGAEAVKRLKKELRDQMQEAGAQSRRHDTKGLFRTACSTDLLFLIDATSSMQPYIDSAKEQVRSIVADIKQDFLNESEVRIAVVSYRDHHDRTNIQALDFTTSMEEVHQFLSALRAKGGAPDFPEDVLGGLQKAAHTTWEQQTRCLIHITDAPPHGSELHDFPERRDSHYFKCGSEPHGLTYKPVLEQLIQLRVNYALLRITSHTDRMALRFAEVYGYANASLHNHNAYYTEAATHKASIKAGTSVKKRQSSGVNFGELQLGTTYQALRRLVVSSVTGSITRSADRLTMALGARSAGNALLSPADLTNVQEAGTGRSHGVAATPLETTPPQWKTTGWLDKKLELEGFCPALITHDAETLNSMVASNDHIKISTARLTVFARSKPFAEGALRQASYARTACSLMNKYVVKSFIRSGHTRAHVAEDMQIQALCKAFALEFNGLLSIEPPLDFLVTSCLQEQSKTSSTASGDCLSLEPFIEGDYVKYNNNEMFVNEELADDSFNQMAQAFSHFTFERSWGHMLVNDLQGVGRILTDPSIQTKDHERFKLSDTNLHEESFKFFFAKHQCNDYCAALELESCKSMFATGDWAFRETWPAAKPTVCCSNKLCRNIIRESSAQQDPNYPDCHWCRSCWPQLQSFKTAWVCMEPGPNHVFEINKFFHESQGDLPPRKCPDHIEKSAGATSAAAAGGNMWRKMRPTPATETVSGRIW